MFNLSIIPNLQKKEDKQIKRCHWVIAHWNIMLSKFKSYSKTCVRRENSGKIGKEGRSERRKNKRKKEKGGKIVRKMEKLEERERERQS